MRVRRLVALTLVGFFVSAGEVCATSLPQSNERKITIEEVEQMSRDRWSIEEEVEKCECEPIEVEISYYTDLLCENTSYGSVDAQGNRLVYGTIAVPREIPLGTRLHINNIGDFVARDRGSKKHIRIKDDGVWRIDLFEPRLKGESDNTYWTRVNNKGKLKTKALVYCGHCFE